MDRVVVDLGTGDGRAVLARAAAEPNSLVLGIDADAAAMATASRRAARRPERGGRRNAWFVVAAAERLPPELLGVASLVTVTLPWGSLLAGVLGRDAEALRGLASIVAPGGRVQVVYSVERRDGLPFATIDATARDAIGDAWASVGFALEGLRPTTSDDIETLHSTWARRLRLGRERTAWRLAVRRRPARDVAAAPLACAE